MVEFKRESDLYAPVRDWLVEHGYTIYVEMFDADIIAMKDGRLLAVELKLCCSHELYMQLMSRTSWADEVMGAVASSPRMIAGLRQAGFGLLTLETGKVRQRLKPRPQPWMWHKKRAYRMKRLLSMAPAMAHEMAGLPACAKLREQRLMRNLPEKDAALKGGT